MDENSLPNCSLNHSPIGCPLMDKDRCFFAIEYTDANNARDKANIEKPKVFDSELYANNPVSTVARRQDIKSNAELAVEALSTIFLADILFVFML